MFPMNRRPIPLTVEYDSRGERTRKAFSDALKARRFYAKKLAQNKNPKVVKAAK